MTDAKQVVEEIISQAKIAREEVCENKAKAVMKDAKEADMVDASLSLSLSHGGEKHNNNKTSVSMPTDKSLGVIPEVEVWQSQEVGKEGKMVDVEKEMKKEEEKKGMSPSCVPAFVPAEPVTVRNYGNHDSIISQGNDQLWYIQCDYLGPAPVLVAVCEGCGYGYPNGFDNVFFYGIANFTTGRTISAAQPRMTGIAAGDVNACGWCLFVGEDEPLLI